MGKKIWNALLLFLNAVVALLLLFACLAPHISSETRPVLSLFSLLVPLMLLANIAFVIYWTFRFKKAVIFSALSLLTAYFSIGSFYQFRSERPIPVQEGLHVLSFNTRLFNKYQWSSNPYIAEQIISFVTESGADIVAFQEFDVSYKDSFPSFPYRHISSGDNSQQAVQAIFSKYPMIHKGSIPFPSSTNTAIFSDIQINQEVIRFYNVHLQSLRFSPNEVSSLDEEKRDRLYKRLKVSFAKQYSQAALVAAHKRDSPYRTLLCGDFNTNQFSSVYYEIKGDDLDSFTESGSGFGKTLDFPYFPMRIDYILSDPSMKFVSHKNYQLQLSDHYPVMATLQL